METAFAYTRRILKKYELQARKSLGQNFLVDDGVLTRIITGSGLGQGDKVLEVGPGTGALTRKLIELAGQVWAVELDDILSEVLKEEFRPVSRVKIIHSDALQLYVGDLGLAPGEKLKLIANLPYYITSPLIRHFLNQRNYFSSMTVMVQEEVARRIVARPGSKDYGVLSIAVQVYSQASILFTVSPGSFMPAPKVSSAVVRLDLLENPRVDPELEEHFFKVIKAAFGQRRKTLINSLSQGLSLDKESVTLIVQRLEIPLQARAESLSIEVFIRLAQVLM